MYQVVKYVWDEWKYYPTEVVSEHVDGEEAWRVANALDRGHSDYIAYRVDFVEQRPAAIAMTLPIVVEVR